MKLPKFPQHLKDGNAVCVIYKNRNLLRLEGVEYKLAYYDVAHVRRFRAFESYEQAKQEADKILTMARRGEMETLAMSKSDLVAYTRSVQALRPFNIAVDAAVSQYVEVREILGNTTPAEAARFFASWHQQEIIAKPVKDVVAEMIAEKKGAGLSSVYLKDLRYRLGTFAEAFHMDMNAVQPHEVRMFMGNLKLSARSHRNFMQTLCTFFEFAKARHYMASDVNLLGEITAMKETAGEIEIFTPDELDKLLKAANCHQLPFVAIGAFAGIRHAEIARLDWSDFKSGFIEIRASKAKTAARRLVPLLPALAAWLQPYRKESGPVCTRKNTSKELMKLAAIAKVPWKHNALRHSFISYRLADIKNIAQVAMEAGNSAQMIFRCYRELVTESQSKAWFSILLAQPANVVPMHAPAAALAAG